VGKVTIQTIALRRVRSTWRTGTINLSRINERERDAIHGEQKPDSKRDFADYP
jgi:hypothetical protein